MERIIPDSIATLGLKLDGLFCHRIDPAKSKTPAPANYPPFLYSYLPRKHPSGGKRTFNFVNGYTAPWSRWDMKKIRYQIGSNEIFETTLQHLFFEIEQLCTKYAFVVTLAEFIAVNFTKSRFYTRRSEAKVARIPYTNRGPNQLTPELALWVLCMLAATSYAPDAPRIDILKRLRPDDEPDDEQAPEQS